MLALTVRQFFAKAGVEPCPILVAVSGGLDSTALLLALLDLRADHFTIRAAHVNHHLRGAESDADEAFVRELCARFDVPLDVVGGALDPDRVRARGVEAAAREVRYARLAELREVTHSRFVATAHQKNDQAETVLMRLLSGSGMNGLRGIHPVRDDGVVRPLLDVTRDQLAAFLRQRGIIPRTDRSNEDPRFLRNRLRVLVRELDAVDNLAAIARQARAQWPILEKAVDDAERESVTIGEKETRFVTLPDNFWLRGALLRRHIRRLDPTARDFDAERLAGELESLRRTSVTKHLELVRDGGTMLLRQKPRATAAYEVEVREDVPTLIPAVGKVVRVARAKDGRPRPIGRRGAGVPQIQLPDANPSRWTVRNRRPGDRFQPLGLAHAKKLKDVLIDRKIPREIRDRLPLLLRNDEIVWIAGVEISERYKVTGNEGVIYEVWMEDESAAEPEPLSGLQR